MSYVRFAGLIAIVITASALFGLGITRLFGPPTLPQAVKADAAPAELQSTAPPSPAASPLLQVAVPEETPPPTALAVELLIPEQPFVSAEPAVPVVLRATQEVNLRQAPGATEPVVGRVPTGAEVTLLGDTVTLPDGGVWVKIRLAQAEGWVNRRLLQ